MRRAVAHDAMPVAGYTTPWSVRSGAVLDLHLSSAAPVEAVRVLRLDLPDEKRVDWPVSELEKPAHRTFEQGSYLRLSAGEMAKAGAVRAIAFELLLTHNPGRRTVLAVGELRLELEDGALSLKTGGRLLLGPEPVPQNVWIDFDLVWGDGGLRLSARSHDRLAPWRWERSLDPIPQNASPEPVLFGSSADEDAPTLNAKWGRIRLQANGGDYLWRFPTRLHHGALAPEGGAGPKLDILNQPTFCVTSPRWDGSSFDPRLVPDHYDAVHCHDDDMAPLEWPASFRAEVPEEAEPGIYAFEVATRQGSERIVFFVRSSRPKAPIVFLVPTATYLAYADEALPPHLFEWKCSDRGHVFARENGLRSLYDYHNDLSGVSITSYRKPKGTLRDDYRYPLCGCPHNLPVDLHLLRFCHENGIAFDLVTDHDLHADGLACLEGHQALMTGSHPEYMSVEMEEAIRAFTAAGGSIAYLGGNGFANTAAFDGDLMELRRSPLEAGRTWDGSVAEQALSITNEPGGFLRHRGRGEFSLVGVAISLMGFEAARSFTRTEESRRPECTWLFEGVGGENFGGEGMVLGGAAGYEVDATDLHLGTHPDTLVIARADGFPQSYLHDPTRWYSGGETEEAERRCAEMTLRHLPNGAIIFSASSVAWCGALPENGRMNDVGRITCNLLRRLSQGQAAKN
ncbi:N,N-dimethylformamidase beta subunit family domain-containing protein [Chelativorans sp. YIM 93263]|uniref:N,N-dimethylformamidase beta subunit family domain-containing protein n=1 Tax=Chelativorans sp. YIM 93263 TaxID=2906648 RepID=UPI0023799523|nr:N,N-dimethylformamidase beta subunit family domain-containing protein [Chelativorans sp. YIM 93263]